MGNISYVPTGVSYIETMFTNPQPISVPSMPDLTMPDLSPKNEYGIGVTGEVFGGTASFEITTRPDIKASLLAGQATPLAGPSAYVGYQASLADGLTGQGLIKPSSVIGGGGTVFVDGVPFSGGYSYDLVDGTHSASAGPGIQGMGGFSGTVSYKPNELPMPGRGTVDPTSPYRNDPMAPSYKPSDSVLDGGGPGGSYPNAPTVTSPTPTPNPGTVGGNGGGNPANDPRV